MAEALRRGVTMEHIHEITKIDIWFLKKVQNIVRMEQKIRALGSMAALDAENRLTLRDEIKKLQHSFDSTILYVTHDQEEAFALSDRIMVLEQGRIHQLDTPENLLHHPADSYVEQFVGQNLLRRLRDLQQYTNMAEEQ